MSATLTLGLAPPDPSERRTDGFQAQLRGVSLADLIQLECLNRTQRVVRVSSRLGVGYLYFRGGQIVHALCRNLVGEDAALEILQWADGSFFGCDRDWPERENITVDWQNLLMRALQARDERSRDNLIAFRGPAVPAPPAPPVATLEITDEADDLFSDDDMNTSSTFAIGGMLVGTDKFSAGMRLSPQGGVATSFGESDELVDAAAYTVRLVHVIGELLGVEEAASMEFVCKDSRCFVTIEPTGHVVAVRGPKSADVQGLRERLKL